MLDGALLHCISEESFSFFEVANVGVLCVVYRACATLNFTFYANFYLNSLNKCLAVTSRVLLGVMRSIAAIASVCASGG